VDLHLSDDQQVFRDSTRRFLRERWPMTVVRRLLENPTGFDRDLWEHAAQLGWTATLVPEELGGGTISGAGVRDLAIVAEELGGALVAGPVLPTNVVAYALARNGAGPLAEEHLPQIAAGKRIAVWLDAGTLDVATVENGFRLTGTASPVQDVHVADILLVSATTEHGVTQLIVPATSPGLHVEVLGSLDRTRRYCRVDFAAVEVPATAVLGRFDAARHELELQRALTLALQCADTVGATDAAYEMTLDYVKKRKAFGRPLGSYQALKHRLAEMLLWLESSKAATSAAIEAVQAEHRALETAHLAKAYVADRCPAIIRDCLQMHGGIGCSWEHDLHLFLRRVDANAAIHGGVDQHLDAVASQIGFQGDS
jgi:alkylation response protein AidB-like acyl-CoA dehydrogenase